MELSQKFRCMLNCIYLGVILLKSVELIKMHEVKYSCKLFKRREIKLEIKVSKTHWKQNALYAFKCTNENMPVSSYNFIWGLVWIEMSVACWDRLMWQSGLFGGQRCTLRTGRLWWIPREAVYQKGKHFNILLKSILLKGLCVHIYIVFNSFLLFSSSIKHEESMPLARKHFSLVISIAIIEIFLLMEDLPPALQKVIYINDDHSSTIQTCECFWYIRYFSLVHWT